MNNRQILDLTNHLSQALDQNYDVVNMDTVLAVISTLEGTTITKEQLEATRLAKYINQLRRRTNNDNLARRAKSLLKKWREMVGMQQTGGDAQQYLPSSALPLASTNATNLNSGGDNNPALIITQSSPETRVTLEHVAGTRTEYAKVTTSNTASASSVRCANAERFDKSNMSKSGEFTLTDSKSSPPSAPTSFSNLISNLNNCSNNINFSNKQTAQQNCLASFVIDHSSNSNSTSNYTTVVGQRPPKMDATPIVIDIDSDSGEHAPPILQQSSKAAIQPMSSLPMPIFSHGKSNQKKSKKDKKRKEKVENKEEDSHVTSGFATNAVGLTSKAAVGVLSNNTGSKLQPSSECATMSNISEILSISNSSMSSLFPSETNTPSALKQNRSQDLDLSFAGKFNTNTNQVADVQSVKKENGREGVAYNSDASSMDRHCKTQPPCSVFENENSTSNSRSNSANEVIDVVSSHENNYNKVFDPEQNAPSLSVSAHAHTAAAYNWDDSRKQNFVQRTGAADTQDADNIMGLSVPKKRGRKKGSKGVDAIIAQETSLSQQIFGSGSKKVKTTKELFNEIQNRQLGIVNDQPQTLPKNVSPRLLQQKHSRSASSCSEPSLHSPQTMDACLTNATISTGATRSSPDNISNAVEDARYTDSDSITSEPSNDGSKNMHKTKRVIAVDSNSSTQLALFAKREKMLAECEMHKKLIEAGADFNADAISLRRIEKKLKEALKQLPPSEPIHVIEAKYKAQLVPCTCALIEDLSNVMKPTEDELDDKGATKVLTDINTFVGPDNDVVISVPVAKNPSDSNHVTETAKSTPTSAAPKPKKSIFDLDFDDDEEESLVAGGTANTTSTQPVQMDETITHSAGVPNSADMEHPNELNSTNAQIRAEPKEQLQETLETETQVNTFSQMYRIVEDPDCTAKQRYELQTNQITNFHIDALHNCYIPNVNGNWDDTKLVATEKELLPVYAVTDGSDVVVKYGALINERIPKDLSQLTFRKTYKAVQKTVNTGRLVHVPFLGVAKCLPSCRKQHRERLRLAQKQKAAEIKEQSVDNAADTAISADVSEPAGTSVLTEHTSDDTDIHCKKAETSASELHVNVTDESSLCTIAEPKCDVAIVADDALPPSGVDIADDSLNHNLGDIANDDVMAISASREHEDSNDEKGLATGSSLVDHDTVNEGAVEKEEAEAAEPAEPTEKQLTSRRSSACSSNSSLSKTQNCINKKLRDQRLMQSQRKNALETDNDANEDEEEQQRGISKSSKRKRKKRKKFKDAHDPPFDSDKQQGREKGNARRRIKRIRIAINGDIATQRQVTFVGSSSNYSSDSGSGKPYCDLEKELTENDISTGERTHASAESDCGNGNDGNDDANNDNDKESDTDSDSDVNNVAHEDSSLQSGTSSMASDKVDASNKASIDRIDDDDYENTSMGLATNSNLEHPEQEYAVVQHPLMGCSGSNKHIVLTIKKTPSKANSPASTLAAVSPRMSATSNDIKYSVGEMATQDGDERPCNDTPMEAKLDKPVDDSPLLLLAKDDVPMEQPTKQSSRIKSRRRRRRYQKSFRRTINHNDLQRILNGSSTANRPQLTARKVHQQLFFADELYGWNCDGQRQRIFNCDSCSSSCDEDSEFECLAADPTAQKSESVDGDETINKSQVKETTANKIVDPDSSRFPTMSDSSGVEDNDSIVKAQSVDVGDIINEEETLPTLNNYLLNSFNVIYPNDAKPTVNDSNCAQSAIGDNEHCVGDDKLQQLNLLQNKHCDDYNNLYNNNNLNIIKYSLENSDKCNDSTSKKNADEKVDCETMSPTPVTVTTAAPTSATASPAKAADSTGGSVPIYTSPTSGPVPLYRQPIAYSEFRTGIRTVDADVSDEQGNNCAHIQQFKEWHQMLQLRSYNNELLTVLPYVLLE